MALRRLFLFLILLLTISGCAAIRQAQQDYERCWSDPVCHQNMLTKAKIYGEIGSTTGTASGLPWAGSVAGSLLSGGALLAFGIIGGRALRKKEEVK